MSEQKHKLHILWGTFGINGEWRPNHRLEMSPDEQWRRNQETLEAIRKDVPMSQGHDKYHESQWRDSVQEQRLDDDCAEPSADAGMQMLAGLLLFAMFGMLVLIFA